MSRQRLGATLTEAIVSLALTSMLLVSLANFMNVGTRYFLHSTLLTEIQQSCVVASNLLVGELLETNRDTVKTDANHTCVVFGSPRNSNNGIELAPGSDITLKWFSLVGFYVQEGVDGPSLFRKERPIDLAHTPPQPQINPPVALVGWVNTGYWSGLSAQARLIATRVYYVEATSQTTVRVRLGVRSRDHLFEVRMDTGLKPRN